MPRYKHFKGPKAPIGGKDGCGTSYGKEGGHGDPLPDKMTQLPNDEGKMTLSTKSLLDVTIGDSMTGGLDGAQWSGGTKPGRQGGW